MANVQRISKAVEPSLGRKVWPWHGAWILLGSVDDQAMLRMAGSAGGAGWVSTGTKALEEVLAEELPGATQRLIRRLLPGPAVFVGRGGGALVRAGGRAWDVLLGVDALLPIESPGTGGVEIRRPGGDPVLDREDAERLLREAGVDAEWAAAGTKDDRSRRAATVIEVPVHADDGLPAFRVLRTGGYEERFIAKQLAINVLFVCTGNTCRSPMAEAIALGLSKRAAGSAGVQLRIASAGTGASAGAPASPEAVKAVRELGFTGALGTHRSKPLSPRLVAEADAIYTMSRSHLAAVVEMAPEAQARVMTLDPEGGDVPDPIGMSQEVYQRTARRIMEMIKRRFKELGT